MTKLMWWYFGLVLICAPLLCEIGDRLDFNDVVSLRTASEPFSVPWKSSATAATLRIGGILLVLVSICGCLIATGVRRAPFTKWESIVFGACTVLSLCLVFFVGISDEGKIDNLNGDVLKALIRTGGSEQPATYFRQLSNARQVLPWPYLKSGKLRTREGDRRFILVLSDADYFDQESPDEDLGYVGRRSSLKYFSAILWMCGYQLPNVSEIDVHLEVSDDKGSAVRYHSRLTPDARFVGQWQTLLERLGWYSFGLASWKYGAERPGDAEVSSLISKNMIVDLDTASGKKFYRVPKGP